MPLNAICQALVQSCLQIRLPSHPLLSKKHNAVPCCLLKTTGAIAANHPPANTMPSYAAHRRQVMSARADHVVKSWRWTLSLMFCVQLFRQP